MFLVGGGGAASSRFAGSSGFFTHQTNDISQHESLFFDITIGDGGSSCCPSPVQYNTVQYSGKPTTVSWAQQEGGQVIRKLSARGGEGAGGAGWSGVTGEIGGYNGGYGTYELLPSFCQVNLTPGQAGYGQADGNGAGGVIVDGQKPFRSAFWDGEGYGAGGGVDGRSGYPGVVVLVLCEPHNPVELDQYDYEGSVIWDYDNIPL